jgi:hypothetical protein
VTAERLTLSNGVTVTNDDEGGLWVKQTDATNIFEVYLTPEERDELVAYLTSPR